MPRSTEGYLSQMTYAERREAQQAWEAEYGLSHYYQHQPRAMTVTEKRQFARLRTEAQKQEFLAETIFKNVIAHQQAQARADWQAQIQASYPASQYDVTFLEDSAQITPRLISPTSTRGLPIVHEWGTLEREAQVAFRAIEAQRAQESAQTVGIDWTAPQYRGVPRGRQGLAEFDIPYYLGDTVTSRNGDPVPTLFADYMRAREPQSDTLFADYMRAKRQAELVPYESLIPPLVREGWQVVPSEPKQYFAEFMDLNKELMISRIPASERTGADVPLHEATWRFLFEGGMEKAGVDWVYSLFGKETPKEYTPISPLLMGGQGSFAYTFGGALKGVVKEAESTFGFVEALASAPTQRSYIQTLGGSLVGEGVSFVGGQPLGTQLGRYAESLHPEVGGAELLGELVGVYAISRGFSFAIGKVGGRITEWALGTRAGQALKFSPVAKALQKVKLALPTFRGSRADIWLAKHSKWYYSRTGGLAVHEVVIPYVPGRASFSLLQASQRAGTFLTTPRTSGVWIGKGFVTPATKSMKHLISRGGSLSIGYLRELSFKKTPIELVAEQRRVLPVVTQTQVTRMGIFPYVGRGGASVTRQLLTPSLASLGLGLVPKIIPKIEPLEWQPSLEREMQRLRSLTQVTSTQKQRQLLIFPTLQLPVQVSKLSLPTLQMPKPKQLERTIPLLAPFQTLQQAQKQRLKLLPLQLQKLKVPLLFPTIPLLAPPSFPPPPLRRMPESFGRSRDDRALFGRWGKREHDIKSAKQLWADFKLGLDRPRLVRKAKKKPKRKGKRKTKKRRWRMTL